MSNNYWQIKKQSEQFNYGETVTSKVTAYVATWESRCYPDGIPDEVSDKLANSGRVPSYKAIALAILKNDLNFGSLGFQGRYSEFYGMLKTINNQENEKQLRLC